MWTARAFNYHGSRLWSFSGLFYNPTAVDEDVVIYAHPIFLEYGSSTSIKTANQFQYFGKKYVSLNNGVFLLNIQHLTLSTFLYAEYIGSMAEKLRLMVENSQTAPKMGRGAGASIGGNTRSVNESPKGSFNISERVLVSRPVLGITSPGALQPSIQLEQKFS